MALQALMNGLESYDRRHGWRGAWGNIPVQRHLAAQKPEDGRRPSCPQKSARAVRAPGLADRPSYEKGAIGFGSKPLMAAPVHDPQ